MENPSYSSIVFRLAFLLFLGSHAFIVQSRHHRLLFDDQDGGDTGFQTYIIHVDEPEGGTDKFGDEDLKNWHQSFLPNGTIGSGEPRLLHSYRHTVSGFTARLTPSEVSAMQAMEGFAYARIDHELVGAITYTTSQFLGLSEPAGLWQSSSSGDGMIIGMIDSGIIPSHPSFRSDELSAPTAKWKGRCDVISCNNKLIGAIGFLNGNGSSVSPIDENGHGTHTASTAAGTAVRDANVLGNANGTAVGTAPGSHLAIYRVLDQNNRGYESDFLQGVDRAIFDGVDVLSMSLSLHDSTPLYENGIAIASFAAILQGIVPCASARNAGPAESSIGNDAPWLLTVGASSFDRRIAAMVKLGNGIELAGQSAYQPDTFSSMQLPLVYPGVNGSADGLGCEASAIDQLDIKGKIVMCMIGGGDSFEIIKAAGGVAMILTNSQTGGFTTFAEPYVLPASHVSYSDAQRIDNYFRTSTNPTATLIFKGTQFGARPSPTVASFSSRGPSLVNGGIAKPDILAPGVNVLAAWPFNVGPNATGNSNSSFNFLSGTSMATPHISGIAAMFKRNHPDWSPAAIKSAMMTTAHSLDLDGKPIKDEGNEYLPATIFARGAGHVNPAQANDPGLVYDIKPDDYISYLCGIYNNDTQVRLIVRQRINCSTHPVMKAEDLNYPSIAVSLGTGQNKSIGRTLTNVGPELNYTLTIVEPEGVTVAADTYNLKFSRIGEQKSFQLLFTIKVASPRNGEFSEGILTWSSSKHTVRSPIVVTFT